MKKIMFPVGQGIILLVTGMLFFVAGGAVFPDVNAVHDCASDELHLSGRCPHSVWKHHAGDLGLWVGFAILAFGLSSGWYWFHLKRLKRLEVIVRAMPACAAVVDGDGKIRFLHTPPGDIKPPPRQFEDLPEEIRDAFREPVRLVMETGEACRVEYCIQGRRRRAELVRLGREIFGTATVMWTSTDVDDLYCLSERFRRTLKSISDGVIAVDADENITLVNRTAARLFGRSREEMIGRKVWEFAGLIDKSRKDERFTLIRRTMESGVTVELSENTELEVFQGGRYHIFCAASPIRDEAGHVSGVVLVFRDVTAEVGRAEELREANQLLQAIQDNLPCAFFVKDADDDFRYLMGNRNYADFLSTTCEEIRGKTDSELFPTRENADACRNSDLAAMEQGSCDVNEQVRIDGKSYTFRCIKNRLDRKDGRRLLLGICVDITEEKRLQQELRDVRFHRKADLPAETGTAEAAPADTQDAAVKTVSVLVVDDVELNLKVLRAMCVKLGVTDIVAVSSAGKALEELEKRSFDLMLTDLWMPGMDGNALREKIRAERRWAAMTVVAVTADAEARENMSFDAVLLKPVTLEKVRQILALTENHGGTEK